MFGLTWLSVWSAVKKIPWQVYACSGFLLFCFFVYKYGQHTVQLKWDSSVKTQKERAKLFEGVQTSISVSARIEYKEKLKVIHEKGETIIKQVPIYISKDLTPLPAEFRMLHDTGVFNAFPGTSEGTLGSPVEVATATTTILSNYQACHVNAASLEVLQAWVRAQRQAYLDQCKQPGVRCKVGK